MSVSGQGSTSAAALVATLAMLGLSACAGDFAVNDDPCVIHVVVTPEPADASSFRPLRATATITNYPGVATFEWEVSRDAVVIPTTYASADRSEIEFFAEQVGIYRVEARAGSCPAYVRNVNVRMPGAEQRLFRVRITPPAAVAAAPQERVVVVPSGADLDYGPLMLEPSLPITGTVRSGATLVPAYLRFSAPGNPAPVAETSSGSEGTFQARLGGGVHDVLVVPFGDLAPIALAAWNPTTTTVLEVPAGLAVTGEVHAPGGALLAGARVSMRVAGVPSTVAVTDANGRFTLQARAGAAGASVELVVLPPADSGLPRLLGTSSELVLTQPVTIRYDLGMSRRDVGGLLLQRGGAPAAGAAVTFVADLAGAGTATAGGQAPLRGLVRIAATAGSDGRIAATQVPRAALAAVVRVTSGELAVLPFDAAGTPPTALNVGAMPRVTGSVKLAGAGAVSAPGALIRLRPQGALALADVPVVSAVAGGDGAFSIAAAAGGSYTALLSDPLGRGAPVAAAVPAPGPLGALALGAGLRFESSVGLSGSAQPVRGAAIELLCYACTGLERQRPIGATISGEDGTFTLVVPDGVTAAAVPSVRAVRHFAAAPSR